MLMGCGYCEWFRCEADYISVKGTMGTCVRYPKEIEKMSTSICGEFKRKQRNQRRKKW